MKSPSKGRRAAFALLPVLVLATAVLGAGPAAASSAPSSGWNDYACEPSAAHPHPVVLVHGTAGNGTDNWLVLAPYLEARGYCVYSFDYGMLPGDTLIGGLGPITASARQLSAEVDKVLAATGASKVDIVGHSQGGMMPRYYLKFLGGAAKTDTLVGIAPDNHGAGLSGLTSALTYFPGASGLVKAITPGLADQLTGSSFLRKLNAGGDTVPGVHYTVIATRYDEVANPLTSDFLTGPDVHNILIQNECPLDVSEHVTLGVTDTIADHDVANALDPANATPTTCLSLL